MRLWIFRTFFFLIAFMATERFCHKETKGFRIQKIQASLPEIECQNLYTASELRDILSQTFTFLNSGGESYVFASKDNNYVLKFFKFHHMRPNSLEEFLIPPPFRKKFIQHRRSQLNAFLASCKFAQDRFQEGTGLIHLHINPTNDLNIQLQLYDAIGVLHKLDIDKFPFALQERASMAYPTLTALAEAKEYEALKIRLSSLLDLIVSRCEAGLADHDARKRNFGFIGEKAIELDLGSFSLNENLKEPTERNKILLHESLRLKQYIKKRHPEISDFLDQEINERLKKNSI